MYVIHALCAKKYCIHYPGKFDLVCRNGENTTLEKNCPAMSRWD
jgi:hypothetical protein